MRARLDVIARVLLNPRLRRVALAFLGFGCAEYGVWVAVLVYAYQHGGTGMAAAIAVIQLVPAALVAPAAAQLADRRSAAGALWASYVIQAVALLATGSAFLLGAPSALGYACAVLAASAVTLSRPAQAALLPTLVTRASELTAANAMSSWVESASLLVGPATAGALTGLGGPGLAVAAFGVVLVAGALLVSGLRRTCDEAEGGGEAGEDAPAEGSADSVVAVCRQNRALVALLGLFLAEYAVEGALDVLVVVLAVGQLGLGDSGPGYLDAMFGVGAVLGGLGAVGLIGRRRMSGPLFAAALTWGLAFAALGGWPTVAAAFVLVGVSGASRTVFETAGRTILHRAVPGHVHGRMFGVLEGLAMAGLAVGSLSVPLLVGLGGVRAALGGAGAALILVTASGLVAVRRLDDAAAVPAAAIALVRGCAMLAALPAPVVEDLSRALVAVHVPAGQDVVREGERGDRYYLLADGELTVSRGGRDIRKLACGDGFGEIALLRDGIRTATVTARDAATVYALDRGSFLQALTGSPRTMEAADEVVRARLPLETAEPDRSRVSAQPLT